MATGDTSTSKRQLAKLSSKAVKEKTGRNWEEWIEWLDDRKPAGKTHRQIVALLSEHIESIWYRQKIALSYREVRGNLPPGELLSGYEVGVSRTFPIPMSKAWELVTSEQGLSAWLGEVEDGSIDVAETFKTKEGVTGSVTILEAGSHFRMAWKPQNWRHSTILQVRVTGSKSKTACKSVISFHHEKLPRAIDRDAMKRRWEEKLYELAEIIKGK